MTQTAEKLPEGWSYAEDQLSPPVAEAPLPAGWTYTEPSAPTPAVSAPAPTPAPTPSVQPSPAPQPISPALPVRPVPQEATREFSPEGFDITDTFVRPPIAAWQRNRLQPGLARPQDTISFEGETGPYVQYSYARIESIIERSDQVINVDLDYRLLTHEKEIYLINQLNHFPEILSNAIETYGIHIIPQYLLTLTQAFSSFYSACRVISDDKELEYVIYPSC